MYSILIICVTSILCGFVPLNKDILLNADTTIIGKVIAIDSGFAKPEYEYKGVKYYYGIQHVKVVLKEPTDPDIVGDTVVLANVYSILTDFNSNKESLKFVVGQDYAFYVHPFNPCKSDFPRIQGTCSGDGKTFFPESNKLIKQYQSINRIIFSFNYRKL